jgi:polysaccharide biosynthesis protein PslA
MAQTSWLPISHGHRRGERLFELLAALALFAVALPLIALVSLAIKCESRGPLICRQQRMGPGDRRFYAYKFRCTTLSFERPSVGRADRTGDITRIGKLLRYTRMENLPQLLNVVRGEMSCINPRLGCPFFLE